MPNANRLMPGTPFSNLGLPTAAEASNRPAMRPDLQWLDNGFNYIVDSDIRPPFGNYEVNP